MKARLVVGVAALWLLVALLWAAQMTLLAGLEGNPMTLGAALVPTLINFLPWIPVTWAVVALSIAFPIGRRSWNPHLWVHLLAVPLVAFGANILVVLGFWVTNGIFRGLGVLMQQGAYWGTRRLHVAALLYIAIAALTHWVRFYMETRDRQLHVARLEGQLARARLQALNAQIRPHFLFNTLHTVGQHWRSGRNSEADALLDHLGALFQRVQSVTSLSEVPLDEELELIRDYLAIEEARFPDRLRVQIDATPEALACHVPPLLLQPLVENAIRHGISASSSAGQVSITASVAEGILLVEVVDDGPGMTAASPSPGTGTGLPNTRERLAQLCGDSARLEIDSPPDGGVTVRVRLPARDTPSLDGFEGSGAS